MRQPLVAANWKMNGSSALLAELLARLIERLPNAGEEVLICPPFPYLASAAAMLDGSEMQLGAQNLHAAESGAFTGEVSAAMLKETGCSFALVGHSERRQLFAEDDAIVADKFGAALRTGLVPVLCVGETLAERDSGDTLKVVLRQLGAVTDRHGVNSLAGAVLAYEPVWAIGTGRTASPEQAQEVHVGLRQSIPEHIGRELRILYGGSVKAANAEELFAQADIDGGLIGGASLNSEEFVAICAAAKAE